MNYPANLGVPENVYLAVESPRALRPRRLACAAVLAVAISGLPAAAQFQQYTSPGSLGVESAPAKEAMEKSVGNAPWRLGPFRFQPYIGVKDVGYVENLRGNDGRPLDDYTATFGLGLKGYLPIGPKVVLAAHYLPEYTWWKESTDLRGWHLRSGVGLYAFFNHMTVELKGTGTDLLDYVSAEFDSPATVDTLALDLDTAIDLHGPWAVTVGGAFRDIAYDDTGVENVFSNQLELLDREERRARVGVRYTLQNGFKIGLGAHWTWADFEDVGRDRSSEGFGPSLMISHDGERWSAGIDVSRFDLEPSEPTSQFVPYSEVTGSARVAWRGRSRIGATGYAGRNIVFTLLDDTSYFVDQRYGASLDYLLGWRTQLRGFAEIGTNEFQGLAGAGINREDDYFGYGGSLQIKITESTTFLASLIRQDWDSSFPGADRTITTLRVNLNLGSGLLSPW
jgi:hypothetical protein